MCLRQQTSTFQTRLLFSARHIGRVDYVLLSNGVSVKRASADDTYQQTRSHIRLITQADSAWDRFFLSGNGVNYGAARTRIIFA